MSQTTPGDPVQRFWFLHMMRTGGTSFLWQCRVNFPGMATYPHKSDLSEVKIEEIIAVTSARHFGALPTQRLDQIRCVATHAPYFATELVPYDYVMLTKLRDPVERVWSHLKEWQRGAAGFVGRPLEEIYEEDYMALSCRNHFTKMLALCDDDGEDVFSTSITIDDARVELAKRRLASFDLVGIQGDEERFYDALTNRYGWHFEDAARVNETPKVDIPEAFARRIRADNQADIELFEFARTELVRR